MFSFGRKKEPQCKVATPDEIVLKLQRYHEMINEPHNFVPGDYVVTKVTVLDLGLDKKFHLVEKGYILETDGKRIIMASYDQRSGKIEISTEYGYYYTKYNASEIDVTLKEFVEDKPLDKNNIKSGMFIRIRKGIPPLSHHGKTTSLYIDSNNNLLEPYLITEYDESKGSASIIAYTDNDKLVTKLSVPWYLCVLWE